MIQAQLQKTLRSSKGDLNLEMELNLVPGSFNALFGPSGAGKTSTLRMLSGLMTPDAGQIKNEETIWFDSKVKVILKPQHRKVGMVFQQPALFPNMSILQNIEYAAADPTDSGFINELLEATELKGLEHQKPGQLSGGQLRRVALIRALAQRPELLLLDEPFSALDEPTKAKLHQYLADLHQRFGFTTLLVSHDLAEVCKLATKVWLLNDGKIEKSGTPAAVFELQEAVNNVQLVGKVLQIKEDSLSLLINGNMVNWQMNQKQHNYKVGELVHLDLPLENGKISQIVSIQ